MTGQPQVNITFSHYRNVTPNPRDYIQTYRVTNSSVWADRPSTDDGPAQGELACGTCRATVAYRLWSATATRRRRQLLHRWSLALWATSAAALIGILIDPPNLTDPSTTLTGMTCLGIAAVAAFAGLLLRIQSGEEKGIRGRAKRPNGKRAWLHRLDVYDPDFPTRTEAKYS